MSLALEGQVFWGPSQEAEGVSVVNDTMMEHGRQAAGALKDKVSLVTGSTSGIGLGIARALAASGSAVVLNGFGKPEDIEAAQSGIRDDFGVPVTFSGADRSKPVSASCSLSFL
jgi:hypothetical protein